MANTAVTLPDARKSVLSNQERAQGFTHKFKVLYTDVDEGGGSSDTVTVTLGNTPTNFIITKTVVNVSTAFAGTGGLAIEVGTDGDPNNFLSSTTVLTAGPINTGFSSQTGSYAAASDVLSAVFTNSSSGSPSALSAGELDIYLAMHDVNDLG
jgi:hypothetical protein